MSRQVLGQVTPTGFEDKAFGWSGFLQTGYPYGVYGCALNQTL